MTTLRSLCRFFVLAGAAAALPLLGACTIYNSADDAGQQMQEADNPPPLAPEETIPVISDPQAQIWMPGYWGMNAAGQFVWVPGRVVARPSPTAVWDTARWVHHKYGWTFQKGHWE